MAKRSSPVIALDGPAGAGKSTVGRALADALGLRYLDTGLMYRAITALAHRQGVSPADGTMLARIARETQFDLTPGSADSLLVNGQEVGDEVRTPGVDADVSAVSAHSELRQVLVERQRELARRGGIVMVGRDIGTIVLPRADVKLWVTASARTRAVRRNLERAEPHDDAAVEREMARIEARDERDSSRRVSPLRKADDAIVVETDALTPREAAALALARIRDVLHGTV